MMTRHAPSPRFPRSKSYSESAEYPITIQPTHSTNHVPDRKWKCGPAQGTFPDPQHRGSGRAAELHCVTLHLRHLFGDSATWPGRANPLPNLTTHDTTG